MEKNQDPSAIVMDKAMFDELRHLAYIGAQESGSEDTLRRVEKHILKFNPVYAGVVRAEQQRELAEVQEGYKRALKFFNEHQGKPVFLVDPKLGVMVLRMLRVEKASDRITCVPVKEYVETVQGRLDAIEGPGHDTHMKMHERIRLKMERHINPKYLTVDAEEALKKYGDQQDLINSNHVLPEEDVQTAWQQALQEFQSTAARSSETPT